MTTRAGKDEALERAEQIVARSVVAALAATAVARVAVSFHRSRLITLARESAHGFERLPVAERVRCALSIIAVALAGHVIIAAMLPAPARPTVALSAVALLGAILAARAASVRSR
jgi:hypothetical protein